MVGVVLSAFFCNIEETGVEGQWPHLLSFWRDRHGKNSPIHTASVDEASGFDRRFDRKLTQVRSTP
jgi:hypothetical protein